MLFFDPGGRSVVVVVVVVFLVVEKWKDKRDYPIACRAEREKEPSSSGDDTVLK